MDKLELNWLEIHRVYSSSLQDVLQNYQVLFAVGIGTWKDYKAKIVVDSTVQPRFLRPHIQSLML